MALTRIRCDWARLPAQPRRCGPRDYAHALLEELHAVQKTEMGAWLHCPCSDEGVCQIVELAYYASLLEEEGRTPQFSVVFGIDDEESLPDPLITRFPAPIPVSDVFDLVKIAPALSRRRCALWIAERKDKGGELHLECLGLLNAGAASQRIMIGYPDSLATASRTVVDKQTYLRLSIEGSGHLRGSFGLLWEYTLRGGQILPTVAFSMTPPLAALFEDMERIVRTRFTERYPDVRLADYILQNAREITHLWTRVLEMTVDAQHGGTILVLPEESATLPLIRGRYHVEAGFPVDLDLGSLMVDFSAACARLAWLRNAATTFRPESIVEELGDLQTVWLARRNALQVAIETIAGLTEVDGCVVIDRGLHVHLFGGRIRNARQDSASATLLELRDWYNRDESLDAGVARLGTRNQSACGFCRENPNALAFVISQDAELRVYASDADHAYAFEALAPC